MSTSTITIPKKEYRELVEKRFRYEHLRQIMEEDIFSAPPAKSAKEIIKFFKETKQYSQKFLESLEKGLERSSCFRA